ncbi:MAG: HAD-IB family phosphatase [Nitrososphaerota archaeon]|nr:HAD-IB family phosphatase [Nitrososphaerota archaeon]MDG7047052.1 HAD-IB family phosphatase [Nitrososphaerota archaeon]
MPVQYRVGFFDMDGTLINENTWELIYRRLGCKDSGWLDRYLMGKISYHRLMKMDVGSWISVRGRVSLREIEDMADLISVKEGAKTLMNKIISNNIVPVMVTAGLDVFAKKVAEELGIGNIYCNRLKTDRNYCLTGEGEVPVEPLRKDQIVLKYLKENGLDPHESFSVGDTEYDGSMFKVTRTGFLLANGHKIDIKMNNVIKVKNLTQIADFILS